MRSHQLDNYKVIRKVEENLLIDRCLKGENKAFNILYKRYYNSIYAYCHRLLKGRFDIDDAVQHVFLEAWKSLKRFEGRSLFSTWIIKIAIHTCLSYHRSIKKNSVNISLDTNKISSYDEPLWCIKHQSPLEEALMKEKSITVNKILDKIASKKKLVFILSDMQGMTAPEISNILKIPDATVRTRLFHARKEFVSCIEKNKEYKEILFNQLA